MLLSRIAFLASVVVACLIYTLLRESFRNIVAPDLI